MFTLAKSSKCFDGGPDLDRRISYQVYFKLVLRNFVKIRGQERDQTVVAVDDPLNLIHSFYSLNINISLQKLVIRTHLRPCSF